MTYVIRISEFVTLIESDLNTIAFNYDLSVEYMESVVDTLLLDVLGYHNPNVTRREVYKDEMYESIWDEFGYKLCSLANIRMVAENISVPCLAITVRFGDVIIIKIHRVPQQ